MLDSYKQKSIDDVKEICKYKDDNGGKSPPDNSRLSNKLVNLRRAYKGKGRGHFHPEYLEVAKEAGYPDLFSTDTLEEIKMRTIEEIKAICKYKDENDKKDPPVNNTLLGRKLNTLKQVFKGHRSGKIYPEYVEAATACGYPELFGSIVVPTEPTMETAPRKIKKRHDRKTSVKLTVKDIEEICKFKNENEGKNPPNDSRLSNKLGNLRQAFKNSKYTLKFRPEYLEAATRCGYPDLFNSEDKEDIYKSAKDNALAILAEIFAFRTANEGKNPPANSHLGRKLHDIKKIYNNNPSYYADLATLVADNGCPDLLSRKNYKVKE